MARVVAIPPSVLHQQAGARLRRLIVEGAIAPGAKLNERELAERLKVSRTPLREAIRMLSAEGLVDLLPHRGAVAAELPPQAIADTFEVIACLEGQSGELAAERITEAELSEIRALHYEMLAAHARRDLPTYYLLNAAIHDHINAAARNPVLTRTYRTVNARLQALRFRSPGTKSALLRARQEFFIRLVPRLLCLLWLMFEKRVLRRAPCLAAAANRLPLASFRSAGPSA